MATNILPLCVDLALGCLRMPLGRNPLRTTETNIPLLADHVAQGQGLTPMPKDPGLVSGAQGWIREDQDCPGRKN